jgi:adenosylcobinamide kinase/adenosylcobinamide-phosphate guanylyltransferase
MARRIADHVARRPSDWQTIEAPLTLVAAIEASEGAVRVVDCLTLWLSNLMLAGRDWVAEVDALVACLGRQASPVILVTNEVGWGIVPENALARRFRDASGVMNRRVADIADEVMLVVAGQALRIKPGA